MGAITVTNLGKAYKQYASRFSRLKEWMVPKYIGHQKKWILQNVSFNIASGECVGIIGVNGAGKSTLLKIIIGTTTPTTGEVRVIGRVVALLELGMGFHPDFTGRQNIFIAGQLQGLSIDEISSLSHEIEAFADIGDYIDREVRIYSSGMQARLAFALATCVRPDILIVDEVLSVGDMAFQSKCMQRMNALADSGVTILFVSHGINQVRQFCDKALYIANGGIKSFGPVDQVCDDYQNDLAGHTIANTGLNGNLEGISEALFLSDARPNPDLRKYSVNGEVGGSLDLEFLDFEITNSNNQITSTCAHNEELTIRAKIRANFDVPSGAIVGLLFADKNGYHLMACNTSYYDKFLPHMYAGTIAKVEWRLKFPFANGEFRVDIGIKPDVFSINFYDRVFCASTLTVHPTIDLIGKNFGGYLFANSEIDIKVYESKLATVQADKFL